MRKPNHRTLLAAEFFILSLTFSIVYDPIGISYFLLGVVWIFNHKLAYLEGVLIFIGKGQFSVSFTANAWLSFFPESSLRPLILAILPWWLMMSFLLGIFLGIQISGKMIKMVMKRRAPDLLGMIE